MALALDGAEGTAVGPCLRVDPANLSGLARLAGDTPRWRAQPGVPLAVLAQAGLRQFDGLPGAMTLAEWLAAPAAWPAGRCAQSGVLAADVVLADGVEETLGPFGESDERPLRSATLQRLVPALFQLSTGPDAAACAVGGAWAGRYRLDALRPQAPATVNLAHLLLGHGGTLAWVQEVLLTAVPAAEGREAARRRRWTVRRGRRDAGSTPGSRRCSTRMVVFPYSLFAIATVRGPRVRWAGPAGAGRRTGAARARSHIAPAAVGIEFLPFLY